jgi:signal peptidase II
MIDKGVGMAAAILIVFGIDRLGKFHATSTLEPGQSSPLLGDFVRLTYAESPGAVLGLFRDWSAESQAIIFGLLSLVCGVVVVSFYRGLARGEHGSAAALGAILAGVASNAMDRLHLGVGVDFLQLGFAGSPSLLEFNLADVGIVLGVVTLIVEMLATEMAARAQEDPRK